VFPSHILPADGARGRGERGAAPVTMGAAKLDLVLLALEALTGITSEAMLQTAQEVGAAPILRDRVTLWRLRQANPWRRGRGRKGLDLEEAQALVAVGTRLAQQHHATIRAAVAAWEEGQLHHPPLVDYLERFADLWRDRLQPAAPSTMEAMALKLLVDLLFYGGPAGPQRLWLALLEEAG